MGNDVASILGYAEQRNAVSKKVDTEDRGVAKMEIPTNGGVQQAKAKGEIYGLLLNANKIYWWSEKEALLDAKSLNTDKAWESYSDLTYC